MARFPRMNRTPNSPGADAPSTPSSTPAQQQEQWRQMQNPFGVDQSGRPAQPAPFGTADQQRADRAEWSAANDRYEARNPSPFGEGAGGPNSPFNAPRDVAAEAAQVRQRQAGDTRTPFGVRPGETPAAEPVAPAPETSQPSPFGTDAGQSAPAGKSSLRARLEQAGLTGVGAGGSERANPFAQPAGAGADQGMVTEPQNAEAQHAVARQQTPHPFSQPPADFGDAGMSR